MLVAIPSKGRPDPKVAKSPSLIPSAVLYVPRSEAAAYRSAFPNHQVAGIPDEVKGITRTRNWILDSTTESWVVMIDDDVADQGYRKIEARSTPRIKMGEADWLREWAKLFELATDLGYRIWGTATVGSAFGVLPWTPFLFLTYVTASCMGIRNETGIRFDESFPVKEDYELNLRCIKEDGGVLGARYLFWENYHWDTPGGCHSYRTSQVETDAIARLQAMYPGYVTQVERGGSPYSIDLNLSKRKLA